MICQLCHRDMRAAKREIEIAERDRCRSLSRIDLDAERQDLDYQTMMEALGYTRCHSCRDYTLEPIADAIYGWRKSCRRCVEQIDKERRARVALRRQAR